ncbi:DnaJ domain-containing protein [Desulfosporosinus sp. Sb-LF]|uniref:J domain-containing protein n=1 Tax=Desulfosporosinus sp. Sb-LF TaxID=2560027 RepID=UPI0013050CB6|nr:DnaJ domain-containing protein [Desulfosporosinus sp. Sb-LF]
MGLQTTFMKKYIIYHTGIYESVISLIVFACRYKFGGAKVKDYYSVLEINENATIDEIKTAFRTLMKVWHPDVCSRKDAYERFVEIVEAYETLKSPQQRKLYDEMRKTCDDEPIQKAEENKTTLFEFIVIIVLIIMSLSFVAFIAYKVYNALHGNAINLTPQ